MKKQMRKAAALMTAVVMAAFLGGGFGVRAYAADEGYVEVIPPKYEDAGSFTDGVAGAKLDGKWGFFDKTFKEVTPFKYEDAYRFKEGFAWVKLNGKWGFIDKTGNEIMPPKYDDVYSFTEGMASVKLGGKWGYVDTAGSEIVSPKYDEAFYFCEGMAGVGLNGKYGFIDKAGKEAVPLKYDSFGGFHDGLSAVVLEKENDWGEPTFYYGFIDKTGTEVIPLEYLWAGDFSDGVALICFDKTWVGNMINKSGDVVQGDGEMPAYYKMERAFSEGLIAVTPYDHEIFDLGGSDEWWDSEKWGYVDKNKKVIVPFKYDETKPFSQGLAGVKLNGKWGFVDKTGKEITQFIYNEVGDYADNGTVWVNNGAKEAVLDKNGKEIVPFKYDEVYPFSDGFAGVKLDGKWGYIALAGTPEAAGAAASQEPAPEIPDETPEPAPTAAPEQPASPAPAPAAKATAVPTAQKVFIDSKEVAFDAYNIDGANYVKLRDLAHSISGTEKQFDVSFDGGANAINLLTNTPYTAAGGEMAAGDGKNKDAALTTSVILKDGSEIQLTAYNIGGSNYFKLRDIGKTFNFSTAYDADKNAIMIDTSLPYAD